MRHAGISVTVTSITDVMAFGLGAFTIMPGLQAFCVSAAICIALIFLLQVDISFIFEFDFEYLMATKTYLFRPPGSLPGFRWTNRESRCANMELFPASLWRRLPLSFSF